MDNTKIAKTKKEVKEKKTALVITGDKLQLKNEVETFILGSTLKGKLSETQVGLCLATALSFGLSPIKREIHFVPYQNKTGSYDLSIVVGYEVYLKRAEASGKLKGWAVEFLKDGTQNTCKITIHRSDWVQPFVNTVYENEVKQYSPLWTKSPHFMLKKVTISQSFRWVFPEEVGGLPYTPEELGIGSLEGGQLQQEAKQPEVKIVKATDPQKVKIAILLKEKGYTKEDLYKKYKVTTLSDLEINTASRIIEGLMKLPTRPELPTITPETPQSGAVKADQPKGGAIIDEGEPWEHKEDNLESADKIKGVTQTPAPKTTEKTTKKPPEEENLPANRMQLAWITAHYPDLIKKGLVKSEDIDKIEFTSEKEYKRLFAAYKKV